MSTTSESTPPPGSKRAGKREDWLAHIANRRAHFLTHVDLSQGRGLEIGPLDAGIADPEVHDVRYVDVFDTAGIQEHYADDPNVLLDLIPEVHYPLLHEGRMRPLTEAAAPGAPYDWVIGSHVVEHVPDLIGWLADIAELTVDGGALLLAVPDRRYCFDRHRPPTTTGMALEAHEEGRERPSVRAIYDFFHDVVAADTAALWAGKRPSGRSGRVHDLGHVNAKLAEERAGQYVDCHVWTFTPDSFLEQIKDLRALGLSPWYVESSELPRGELEFHVVLRRLPRGVDVTTAEVDEPDLASDLPDWLDAEWSSADEARRMRRQLRRARQENDRLRKEVAAVRGSTRMRVGDALVGPAAKVRDRLRRRT